MEFLTVGSPAAQLDVIDTTALVDDLLHQLQSRSTVRRVLLVPPDKTRPESLGNELATYVFRKLMPGVHVDILPALGTHRMMSDEELSSMFPGVPRHHILEHRWQTDVEKLGVIESADVQRLSEGRLDYSITVAVNRMLIDGRYDLILSIGQVVPHEVAGIANQAKNIYIGVGGPDLLNKSHYLGAIYGMERIMGRAENPVRELLDRAAELGRHLPIVYLLTVRVHDDRGEVVTRGLFAGDDRRCYERAAALCEQVNIIRLDRTPQKIVVRVSDSYSSTWLANKAIYRTRMAIADGGELVILAKNVKEFAEDTPLNELVTRYGYRGTPATIAAVAADPAMQQKLSVPAHLIHGSTEGRFRVTYAPGCLSREQIEGVGYHYADYGELDRRYPTSLPTGWHRIGGEEIYYIADPGLCLWKT
jgi:nickel-dependent lactate racemase